MIETRTRSCAAKALWLGAAAALGACGGAGIHVANPAATGTLVATSATYVDRVERSIASQDSIAPSVFTDTATLVRLDGQSVCFDVVTQLVQGSGSGMSVPLVEINPSSAQLAYDGGTLRNPTVMPRRVTVGPPQDAQVTNYFVADDDGVGSHAETEQFQFERVSGGGIVCFQHQGQLAPSNHHLRLTYTQVNFTPRFDFQLDAERTPTAWPPGAVVAPGYEPLAR